MTFFFIGQRVRKARGTINIGHTGTVFATTTHRSDAVESLCTLGVIHDQAGRAELFPGVAIIPFAAGSEVWGNPDHYDPILPDGLESIEEINELNQSEQVTA